MRRTAGKCIGHDKSVLSLSFSRDGSELYSGGIDATFRTWDVCTTKQKQLLKGNWGAIRSMSHSPTGEMGIGCADGSIRVVDPKKKAVVREFRASARGVNAVSFSPNGRYFAVGCT